VRTAAAAALVALLAAACGHSSATSTTTTSTTTAPATSAPATTTAPAPSTAATTTAPAPAPVTFTAKQVAGGFDRPVWAGAPLGDQRLFVVEQHTAKIWVIEPGGARHVFFQLKQPVSQGNEQGLLGLAFEPGFAHTGRFVVSFTDANGDTRVVEEPNNRQLLFVHQPFTNHNGGNVVFGPDGLLWLGLGDGGSEGDPNNESQNPNTLLGKLVRIDVRAAKPTPQVFATGLRNPWRFSFDRATGDLWIGDVGQDTWEEIDHLRAPLTPGANFGWRLFEGDHPYDGGNPASPPAHYVPPVFEYSHAEGCSVTGGVVVDGTYVFADYCSAHFWTLRNGQAHRFDVSGVSAPSSFGFDGAGRPLVISLNGEVYRLRIP
jgi:glucose/arabinose dehydrogenase